MGYIEEVLQNEEVKLIDFLGVAFDKKRVAESVIAEQSAIIEGLKEKISILKKVRGK